MEKHNIRNKEGRFAREVTVFQAETRHELKVIHTPDGTPLLVPDFTKPKETPTVAEKPRVEALQRPTINITHATLDDRIETVRRELYYIQNEVDGTDPQIPETILQLPDMPRSKTPLGLLTEKKEKRMQKEQKEKAPRKFSEMLVVFNDTQLLQATDQEALGAFLQYVEANKDKITHLVANGDIADFSAQSSFMKDLGTLNSGKDEVEATKWLVDHLSKTLPKAKKVFILGNHEDRWSHLVLAEMGNEAWVKTMDEQFGLTENGWEQYGYGSGEYYRWHERIFWHGHRSGAAANIPKLELQDAGTSVTTAHINRNMYHESVDALGNRKSGIAHGGFSKDNLGFMKKANTGWSQGFGVYFYDEKSKIEQPYMVTMSHRNPRFIGPDGVIYDGTGWNIPGFEESPKKKK